MAETFTNFARTTLATTINNTDTTIVLTDGAKFPTASFTIVIENEVILVGTRSSNTLSTCVRNQAGSVGGAVSHTSGVTVLHGALKHHLEEIYARGEGIGYTPTWATGGGSIGNGTITGRYQKVGNLVHLEIRMGYGSTTTAGAFDQFKFGLPSGITSRSTAMPAIGVGRVVDVSSGSARLTIRAVIEGAGASEVILERDGGGFNVYKGDPIVFATGDIIDISITFEAA